MGLLGVITIAAYLDRNRYPSRYFRQLIQAIVMVAVLGLFGFAFIDNASHLGGLCGGLLLGWLLFRSHKQATDAKEGLLRFGGLGALLALGIIAAIAVYHLLT